MMERLIVLSQTKSEKKKRRKKEFLLPETLSDYQKFEEEARKLRKERLAAIFSYGKECFSEARTLQWQSKQVLSTPLENEAEYELARRDAKRRKEDAQKLQKKGRTYLSRGAFLALRFWRLPQEIDTSKDEAPYTFWTCHSWARYRASLVEQAKIVNHGETLLSKITPANAKKDEIWNRERRLIRYQDRVFLASLAKRVNEQPHDPWRISWVTDSTSQMTEEELRCAASQIG